MDIQQLSLLREREDHIEFKEAKHNYPFAGGAHTDPRDRRRCVLGYVVALANERGGRLVLGMSDKLPHAVVGSDFALNATGELEDEIYKRLYIRVRCTELFDAEHRRVLVIEVPSRPIGKALRFEGVPLMRVGESLREMDDQEYFNILQEQDPDFSASICKGLSLADLDSDAIEALRRFLYQKRGKTDVMNLPAEQILRDMELLTDEGLNYAALILLGSKDCIHHLLPQNKVVVEYRTTENAIRYSARQEFCGPLLTEIDNIWSYINQPASNPIVHIASWPRLTGVPAYTEETIREAILNAIQHRSFQMGGEVFVKVAPESIVVTNQGGFPYGVNVDNILTVNSSPRSRRLADALARIGMVERSGQGVDVMYANCICEGRPLPDYSQSDDFQVSLRIESRIENVQLRRFLIDYQSSRQPSELLNVLDLLTIYSITKRQSALTNARSVDKLLNTGVLYRHRSGICLMNDSYYAYHPFVVANLVSASVMKHLDYVLSNGPVPMSAFVQEWAGELSPKQVRTMIDSLIGKVIAKTGTGRATKYQFQQLPTNL